MDQTRDTVCDYKVQRSAMALSRALQSEGQHLTEEEALARFESTARFMLGVSAAGFLAKYRRGEFSPIENHPVAAAVINLIPPALIRN